MQSNEELVMLAKDGDREALSQLWKQTERLVFKYAARYFTIGARLGYDVDDIMQEAYFGLVSSVKYYNPDRGHKFSSYVRYGVSNAVRSGLGIRGKEPPPPCLSLDEPVAGDESEKHTLVETLHDPKATQAFEQVDQGDADEQLRAVLRIGYDALKAKRRAVMKARYESGLTLQQIGDMFGVSRQSVYLWEREWLSLYRRPDTMQRIQAIRYA